MSRNRKFGLKVFNKVSYTLIGFIVILAALPTLFKEDIVRIIQNELNKNLEAEISFTNAKLSFINNFPNVYLRLDSLHVISDSSENKLFESKKIQLGFNLMSIVQKSKTPELTYIDIINPKLNLVIHADGNTNYNIYRQDGLADTSSEKQEIEVLLDKIKIENGYLAYTDYQTNSIYELNKLEGELAGKYKGSVFQSKIDLQSEESFVSINNIPYINAFPTHLTGEISYDIDSTTLKILDAKFVMNEFLAFINGFVDVNSDHTAMDLEFQTPDQSLKPFISLLPGAYTEDFSEVEVDGDFNLIGKIHGKYSDSGEYPLYNISAQITNGRIKYPDLPKEITNLNSLILIKALDRRLSNQIIQIDTFHCNIGESMINGDFGIVYSDNSKYSGSVYSDINLEHLQSAWPLPAIETISGLLNSNIKFSFNQNQIDQNAYDEMQFSGRVFSENFRIGMTSYPILNIDKISAVGNAQSWEIIASNVSTQNTSLNGNLIVKDPLALLSSDRFPIVDVKINGDHLDVNEWMNVSTNENFGENDVSYNYIPPDMKINIDSDIKKLTYGEYVIHNLKGNLSFADDQLDIINIRAKWDQSQVYLDGQVASVFSWLSDVKPLSGEMVMKMDYFNLDPWMESSVDSSDSDAAGSDVKYLPENVEISFDAELTKLVYNKVEFDNVVSEINLISQTLEINKLTTSSLEGNLSLSGVYSELEPLRNFDLMLDLSQISFSEIFRQSKVFSTIAPIARHLQGQFNSTLVLNGKIDSKGSLIWDFLNAEGFIETLTAKLSDYKPLDILGEKLGIEKLKNINWQNTKNWFEITEGSIIIKPFDINYQGIPISISGRHQIDLDVNYNMHLAIPRKLMNESSVGQGVNTGLSWVESQLEKTKISEGIGDTIFVVVNITGPFSNPITKLNLSQGKNYGSFSQQAEGQISDIAQEKKDSLTKKIRDSIQSIQDTIIESAQEKVDEKLADVKDKATGILDSITSKASEKGKGAIDSVSKDKFGKLLDSTLVNKVDTIIGKDIDKIKDALKKWDPFKKKKKESSNRGNQ